MTRMQCFRASAGLAGATAVALVLAACSPPRPHIWNSALKSVSTLDCPEDEDGLSRKSVASDGKSCLYRDDDGDQVTLQLVDVTGGDVKAALAPFEAQLRGELPAATPNHSTAPGDDRVDIDLPGIHIHANGHDQDKDGHGSVQINGGEPDKSGPGDQGQASGSKPGVTIDAGDNGAQISVRDDARGVRRYFMLASDTAGPNGYRMVAYEARGPARGPLAVALVMAKSDDHDEVTDAARSLLKHNVGG